MATTENGLYYPSEEEFGDDIADILMHMKKMAESADKTVGEKVSKADGKDLSDNNFSDEYKEKLDDLENYDDSEIKNEIETIQEEQTTQNTEIEDLQTRIGLIENIQSMENMSWKQIQAIVQAGKASTYFKVGDQIETTWKDTATNTTYTVPLDVVSFEDVTIKDNGIEKVVPRNDFTIPLLLTFWRSI